MGYDMGGIADILRKKLNPGVPRVPGVPTGGEQGLDSQLSEADHGTRKKLDGVPGVPNFPTPDTDFPPGHAGHVGEKQVSRNMTPTRASKDAISENRDTWDTQKTPIPEKTPDLSSSQRCHSCEAFTPDPERGRLGLGYCQVRNQHLWSSDDSGCNDYRTKETPKIPVPKYSIGDRVSFLFRDSRTTREGTIEDLQFHWSTVWWYLIKTDGGNSWAAECHIQKGGPA